MGLYYVTKINTQHISKIDFRCNPTHMFQFCTCKYLQRKLKLANPICVCCKIFIDNLFFWDLHSFVFNNVNSLYPSITIGFTWNVFFFCFSLGWNFITPTIRFPQVLQKRANVILPTYLILSYIRLHNGYIIRQYSIQFKRFHV